MEKINRVNFDAIRLHALKTAFKNGLRMESLQGQPASWVFKGLKRLEEGKDLKVEDIKEFDKS